MKSKDIQSTEKTTRREEKVIHLQKIDRKIKEITKKSDIKNYKNKIANKSPNGICRIK